MKIIFYSTLCFEQSYLERINENDYTIVFTSLRLDMDTVDMAKGFDAVSIFANDNASAAILNKLYDHKVRHIIIRESGYDNIDLEEARKLGMAVACVPLHAVNAVAEHAIALLLALSRKLIISDRSVRNLNFLPDEPVGFDLYGKTIGIIGVGKIGTRIAQILHGFGCNLLGFDINPNVALQQQMGMRYADLSAICSQSDVISINTPLLPQTRYIINKKLIDTMKPGVILINTSRGACVNTEDIIEALASGHIGAYGADVYENEKNVFLKDQIDKDFQDTLLNKLLSFSNVLITPHLAFATREALHSSAATTFHIIDRWKMDNTADQELCGIQ